MVALAALPTAALAAGNEGEPPLPPLRSTTAQDELQQRQNAQRAFANLVVRVLPKNRDGTAAPNSRGFGIIVARRGQELIIATPRHVVFNDAHTATPSVRFRTSPNTDVSATRFERSSPQDDLAWLTVPAPAGMELPFAPVATVSRLTGRWVWAIGHGEAWSMSARGGTFDEEDPITRLSLFSGLDVIPGSSGGAVVTADGLAAMILMTAGVGRLSALPMERIRQLLPRFFDGTQSLLVMSEAGGQSPAPAVPRQIPGQPDTVPVRWDERPTWDVGVTVCGFDSQEAQALYLSAEALMRRLNFTNLREGDRIYRRQILGGFVLARQSQVFHYHQQSAAAAAALTAELSRTLGRPFASPIVGAGSGVSPDLMARTVFVHIIGPACHR